MGSSKKAPMPTQVQAVQGPQYGSAMEQANTTSTQQFTPWGKAAGTYDYMGDLMQQQAQAGPQYVGPSDYTNSVYGLGEYAARGQQGAADMAGRNYNFLSSAADVANNPYVQGMLGSNAQQVNEQLRESWLPAIAGSAVGSGSGAMGSSRYGLAQGQAVGRAAQQLANSNSGMMLNAYGAGLGAQQSALGQTGAMQSAYGAPAQTMGQLGQLYEGYQQAAQDAPWKHMQNLGAAQQYLTPLGILRGVTDATGTSASGAEGAYSPKPGVDPSQATQYPPWGYPADQARFGYDQNGVPIGYGQGGPHPVANNPYGNNPYPWNNNPYGSPPYGNPN